MNISRDLKFPSIAGVFPNVKPEDEKNKVMLTKTVDLVSEIFNMKLELRNTQFISPLFTTEKAMEHKRKFTSE